MRLTLAAVLAATVCVAPASAALAVTGLHGAVTRGPTSPVCRIGAPCSAPAARTLLVFRRLGVVVRVETDARGRYRVALAAGTWAVSLARTGVGATVAPSRVRAVAGTMRMVDLSIDTGIR